METGIMEETVDEGVRGKMWRVVKSMCSTVQSAVLIGTGVRQGCVMSPFLFSLFVNGLAREIKAVGKGVQVGRLRVQLLLYTDDIVLISDTQKDLQSMLDCVTEYSRKWRFRVNPKKGKSEVMRFGKTGRSQTKWMLGGKEIYETAQHKYLGVEIHKGIHFTAVKERLLRSARRRMMTVGNGDEERRDARKRLCSSVANVGETSTRVRGSSVGRVCVGGSGENTKRDGKNDSEVQPEDDKRSGVGRVGVVDVERKKRFVEIEVLWQGEDGRRQTCEASVCRESKETRGRKAEQVVR
jgi:hypothetical protein